MMTDEIVAYFRKKVAKPFPWELRNDYRIEIVTAADDFVSATVFRHPKGHLASPVYCGEPLVHVFEDDTKESVLDRLLVSCDRENLQYDTPATGERIETAAQRLDAIAGARKAREAEVRRAFEQMTADPIDNPIDMTSDPLAGFEPNAGPDGDEDDMTEDELLEAVYGASAPIDTDFPFARDQSARDRVLTMMETNWEGPHGAVLLNEAMVIAPSDPDIWIGRATKVADPVARLRLLDAGLRLAWSGVSARSFRGRRDFAYMGNDEKCVVDILLRKAEAHLAAGSYADGYRAAALCLALDHGDRYRAKYVHAALAVLTGDAATGRKLIPVFGWPDGRLGHAPTLWTLALLEAAFGEDPKEKKRTLKQAHDADAEIATRILADEIEGLPTSYDEDETTAAVRNLAAAWKKTDLAGCLKTAGIRPRRGK